MADEISPEALTELLRRWTAGDAAALQQLTPIVYGQLRVLADGYMRQERPDHTLQPTALIHEAYLRLIDQKQPFESRGQFYGVAAHRMRIIVVDHARARNTTKRGNGASKIALDDVEVLSTEMPGVDLIELDEALNKLSAFDERKARAIELRYFAGMSVEETAQLLDISVATLRRDLRLAENWLFRRLAKQ